MQKGTGPDIDGSDDGQRGRLTRSAAVVVAVTFQRLIEDPTRSWSVEEELVLEALRRSATRLNEASNEELGAYISGLSSDQLRGVASNVKGIYHELLFVHAENIDADDVAARVFEATNHPGADVEFMVDGEAINAVQLKAVASPAAVLEHLARYPDIEVIATEEVAAAFPTVGSSGYFNAEISDEVNRVVSELPADSLTTEVAEGAATSAFLAGAMAAGQILRSGTVTRQQFSTAFGDVAVGVVTATVLDVLIYGIA